MNERLIPFLYLFFGIVMGCCAMMLLLGVPGQEGTKELLVDDDAFSYDVTVFKTILEEAEYYNSLKDYDVSKYNCLNKTREFTAYMKEKHNLTLYQVRGVSKDRLKAHRFNCIPFDVQVGLVSGEWASIDLMEWREEDVWLQNVQEMQLRLQEEERSR